MSEVDLTERELDVMNVLWDRGSGTVAEVREALDDDLAYTTVLTVLQILEKKGHARRQEEGRAHRYFPAVERRRARESALRKITRRLFGGSPELLLTHLVRDESLDEDDLERIARLLDRRLGEEEEKPRKPPSEPGEEEEP